MVESKNGRASGSAWRSLSIRYRAAAGRAATPRATPHGRIHLILRSGAGRVR